MLTLTTVCLSCRMATPKLMSEAQVIMIGSQTAQSKGYAPKEFFDPSVTFDRKTRTWTLFYQGRMPDPGNHFLVEIKDDTGEAQLMPGA